MRKLAVLVGLMFCSIYAHACNIDPYKWNARVVPVYYRFDPSRWQVEFTSSMRRWNEAYAGIALQHGQTPGIGPICMETNTTMFVSSVCDKRWDPGVLAITLITYSNGSAVVGKILFNSNEKFDVYRGPARPGNPDFQRVTLHEMGHFLGLDHESRVASIMAPYIGNIETLMADDVACLKRIYPDPAPVL